MAIPVIMPALDVTQESGKLLVWIKKSGDTVTKGEAVFEVETDKAVVEVEAPGDGILAGVCAGEGTVVAFGQTVAWLVSPGEAIPEEAFVAPAGSGDAVHQASGSAPLHVPMPDKNAPAPGASSPKARRLAQEMGIDLGSVGGSGPGGEVLAGDVLAYSDAGKQDGRGPGKVEMQSAAARLVAERTSQGWSSIPHFFVTREVDAGALVALRGRVAPEITQRAGVKPSLNDMLVALTARVLVRHPRLNAQWVGGSIRHHEDIDMGIAIAVGDAVVAGVIRKAQQLDLEAIARRRHVLAERAHAERLQPEDITRPTFTISNLGMFGVDAFTAIIVPPQAGTLAVGRIRDCVVARAGQSAVRPMMNLTLSMDHRVGGGATAARFLDDLATTLEDPQTTL